jgi:hypothetical protein
MSVPIIYCVAVPDVSNSGGDGGQIAVINDDLIAQNFCVLATVGGLLTLTITSGGKNLNTGVYTNVPVIATLSGGVGGLVNVTVAAGVGGTASAVSVAVPGYGYGIGAFSVANSAIGGTASSVITTFQAASVLPCSIPFPIGTKYIELECDVNGPAFITFDTTLTSVGITNGILTTQQSTLTTVASRMAANQVLLRRVTAALPLIAGAPPAALSFVPISLQVIMGTAAA